MLVRLCKFYPKLIMLLRQLKSIVKNAFTTKIEMY